MNSTKNKLKFSACPKRTLIRLVICYKGQNLATKLIVTLGYKLTQYLFIGGEF